METIRFNNCDSIPENFTGIAEYPNGDKEWYKEGKQHRIDGPAVEHWNGSKHWYVEGKRHRVNGPAFESPDGTKCWYIEGEEYKKIIKTQDKIFLGKEIGKYGLEWYKFMTEKGIEEYPLIPGLEYKVIILQPLEEFLRQK